RRFANFRNHRVARGVLDCGPDASGPLFPEAYQTVPMFNLNSEVTGGGGHSEARPKCARPRARQLPSFKPRNVSQPPAHPTLLRPGRPHSEAEIWSSNLTQFRSRRGV